MWTDGFISRGVTSHTPRRHVVKPRRRAKKIPSNRVGAMMVVGNLGAADSTSAASSISSSVVAAAIHVSSEPRTMYIPICDEGTVAELSVEFPTGIMLSDREDVLDDLCAEPMPLRVWLECAVEYYKIGNDAL